MDENQKKIHDLIDGIRFAMLTTLDGDRLVSRPMTPLRIEHDLTVLFVTQRHTDVASQADGHRVNLGFSDDGTFVSLSGTAQLRDDVELKKQLWGPATDAFTDGGPENPDNVVLAVSADSASYWDSAPTPVFVWGVIKGAVTGDKPDAGDHGTVEV